jgi:hypothetical protein
MSNSEARSSRCSNDGDAIHRARDFNARTLECDHALLDEMRKPAWHKAFRGVFGNVAKPAARAARDAFAAAAAPAHPHRADSQPTKIFFTGARPRRSEERNRDRTRPNRAGGDSDGHRRGGARWHPGASDLRLRSTVSSADARRRHRSLRDRAETARHAQPSTQDGVAKASRIADRRRGRATRSRVRSARTPNR